MADIPSLIYQRVDGLGSSTDIVTEVLYVYYRHNYNHHYL